MNFFHTSVLAADFSQFCTCFDACLDANVVPSRDRLCVPLQNLPTSGGPRPHSGPGSKGVVPGPKRIHTVDGSENSAFKTS